MSQNTINFLIVRTAHGDKEAFEALYHEMKKPVYYFALRFSGNHEIAEDVMQDTFITIWSKSGSFIEKGNGRAWILSITKNKALNILKKNRHTCSLDDSLFEAEDEGYFMDAFENNLMLEDLLKTLNKKEVDIVLLRHSVGLTLTEIAKEKNMKKGTIFWAYNNAIKKLRKAYERIGYNENPNSQSN